MDKKVENQIRKADAYSKSILRDQQEDSSLSQSEKDALQSIHKGAYESWREEHLSDFDQDKNWQKVEGQLQARGQKAGKIRMLTIWRSVAAIVVIAVLAGAAYLLYSDMETSNPELVMPGKSIAYLEVNGKTKIDLTLADTLLTFHETKAQIDSGRITYSAEEKKKIRNEYHKINVPRNGEYYVVLSDGTKVWVNSESAIGYYSRFEDNKRIVDLQGEAYFEVAKDENRPFIVKTNNMDVRVLGTHFNVKAYPDETHTYTTLSEGKVQVKMGEEYAVIDPDQQVVLNNGTGKFEQKEVDASIYSAWVKGKFIFKDEPLENIMLTLSRWYDVEVFYPNQDIKDELYSMSVNRYDNIEVLLKKMEKTGALQFELKKNALIVR
jgi:hypothetical protein